MRRSLRQQDQPQLPLLSNLRRHWAEGSMSSVTVQELAHSAASQGAHGMEGAASAGQGGRQPKNLHRDLMTLCGTPHGAPAFTWLRIPMRNGPDFHPVLLPHVFFSELFDHHRSLWEDSIRRPPRAARVFWQRLQHWAVVRDHPHLPRAPWAKTVPLGLHGDAGPFTKQDSAFVTSWNLLLGAAANKGFGRRWLFTMIRKNDLTDENARCSVGSVRLVDERLALGDSARTGLERSGGRYVAEKWRGSLIKLRVDWSSCALSSDSRTGTQLAICAGCAVRRTQSVVSSGQLLATVRVGVPPGGRTQLTWPSSSRSEGQSLRCSAWSSVCCCRASWSTCCIAWTWGSRRTSWPMSSCDASRSERGEPLHTRRTVNDSSTRSALGTDRKERSPNSKEKLALARLRSSGGYPKLKAKGAATRHMASFTLEMAARHCAGPSDRCVLGVVQTLGEILPHRRRGGYASVRCSEDEVARACAPVPPAACPARRWQQSLCGRCPRRCNLFIHLMV